MHRHPMRRATDKSRALVVPLELPEAAGKRSARITLAVEPETRDRLTALASQARISPYASTISNLGWIFARALAKAQVIPRISRGPRRAA